MQRRDFLKYIAISPIILNNNLYSSKLADNRIKTPMLKINGKFVSISWDKAFEIMAKKAKNALKKSVDGIGLITSSNLSLDSAYALTKLFKAGFRTNNIYNLDYNSMQNLTQAQILTFGIDGIANTLEDIKYCDSLISWGNNLTKLIQISDIRKNDKKFKLFNITSKKIDFLDSANNILIKKDSEYYLLNYILYYIINNYEKKLEWDYIKRRLVFVTFDKKMPHNEKYKQWEISYNEFKKSLKQFSFEKIVDFIKPDEIKKDEFKMQIDLLAKTYFNQFEKTLTFYSNNLNKANFGLEFNLSLYSLHLILNKYARVGCGIIPIIKEGLNGVYQEVGLTSDKLPANRYIVYKKHRIEAEIIWNLPKGVLNPVNFRKKDFFKNLITKTKFIWAVEADFLKESDFKDIDFKDKFIVSTSSFWNDTAKMSDLILPNAFFLEKHNIFYTIDRKISITKQKLIPKYDSMSELWQIVEFSDRFKIDEVWKENKSKNYKLKNLLSYVRKKNIKENDTLKKVLFANYKALKYKIKSFELNTEANSDKRKVVGSGEIYFYGFGFYLQKYLFEEFRLFTLYRAKDIANFELNLVKKDIRYPYIKNHSTNYRFNAIDDFYAKEAAKPDDRYIYYGKMGGKMLEFGDLEKITKKIKNSIKYRAKIFAPKI